MSIFDKSKISFIYQTNVLFSSQELSFILFALPLALVKYQRFTFDSLFNPTKEKSESYSHLVMSESLWPYKYL